MSARRSLAPEFYADLIGKPFLAGGRGPDAFDCLGVAMEIARRRGARLPAYESTVEEEARRFDPERGLLGPVRPLAQASAGAVVLLRSFSRRPGELHIGTMLGRWSMIHTHENVRSVVIEPLAQSIWARRVIGFYQLEGCE